MTGVMETALAILVAAAIETPATVEVPAGGDLAAAVARLRPGDTLRLGAGEHAGTLGRLSGVRVEGAGPGATVLTAPEGEDGAVAIGQLALSGLSIRAGPARCALKVLGGTARLDDVALSAGACGAFIDAGRLDGRDVDLAGAHALLVSGGEVALDGGSARASEAGIGVVGGKVALRRFRVTGPGREGGISVARGTVTLEGVTVRSPGPTGISVSAGGHVEGVGVTVSGASESQGFLGDCVQVIRGTIRLHGSTLLGCAGAAVEASGGAVTLEGVDAGGGTAGCLAFVNGTTAELSGNLCAGQGPGLVLASGARANARLNRWWTDPVFWVDCASGARVHLGRGERAREPCTGAR